MKVLPGQPKRTLEQSDALRNACVKGIADNLPIKVIAANLGIAETYAYTILRRLGYEKVIVSVDERWIIHQLRAKKGRFVEGKA